MTDYFPMPNDRLAHDAIVIASCYLNDDIALALVMGPEPPFYTAVEIDLTTGELNKIDTWHNITPAVTESGIADAWGGN